MSAWSILRPHSSETPDDDTEFFIPSGDEADHEPQANAPPDPQPVDPVVAAARLLVLQTVQNPGLLEALRRPGCMTTVELPSLEWDEAISAAWCEIVVGDARPPWDGDEGSVDWKRPHRDAAPWLCFCRDGTSKSHRSDVGNGALRNAVAHHRAVTGFAPSPAKHLPSDLIRAADHRLVVPPMDGPTLAAVVAATVGAPCEQTLPDNLCRLVDPVALRLAQRPDQDAADYLARVRALVEPHATKKSAVMLTDLHGMDEAVRWGQALATDLNAYRKGELSWSDVDPGALIAGPAGTGKTTFARALSQTLGVPLILGSLNRWQAKGHLGDLLGAMAKTFDEARKVVPCVLFIDEIDAFGARDKFQHENADYSIQVVNALLEHIDGVEGRDGIVLLGACNNPDRLDPALRRAGRLDRTITISLPDQAALAAIYRHYLGSALTDDEFQELGRRSLGATGADIEQAVRGARRTAREARRRVTYADVRAEVGGRQEASPEHKWLTAVHEAGHAVAASILAPGTLRWTTIRSMGDADGATATKDEAIPGLRETQAKLAMTLAGRAAERQILGRITVGAGGDATSDLARATLLAARAVASYRLHDDGAVWLGDLTAENVADVLSGWSSVADQVRVLLDEAHQAAAAVAMRHQWAIVVVARLLMKRETLNGADVAHVIEEVEKLQMCREMLSAADAEAAVSAVDDRHSPEALP